MRVYGVKFISEQHTSWWWFASVGGIVADGVNRKGLKKLIWHERL